MMMRYALEIFGMSVVTLSGCFLIGLQVDVCLGHCGEIVTSKFQET